MQIFHLRRNARKINIYNANFPTLADAHNFKYLDKGKAPLGALVLF